jgi:hypothetical protein
MSGFALNLFWCTPVEPEILSEVKDEIHYQDYFAAFDSDNSYSAVLACPSVSVCEMDIPMNSNHVGSREGKDVPKTNVLDIE